MRKPWWPFGLRLSEGLGPTSPEREDFERWFFASKYAQVKIPRSDEVQIAWDAWQAVTAAERKRWSGLRAALVDTLDFVERHSNRWDGVNGKHPMEVVTAARMALGPNVEVTGLRRKD
jgi:hypothetical protein